MKKCNFENAVEGDKVYSMTYGVGKIEEIRDTEDTKYIIAVRFIKGYLYSSFTVKGELLIDDDIPDLYWKKFTIPTRAYEEPIRTSK